jgi:HK97 family phage prohead protease
MSTATQRRSARAASTTQVSNLEMKVFNFELKALGDEVSDAAPRFSGYGAIFFNVDSAGDIIAPGAFAEDLSDYLENGFVGGLNHDWDSPIARPAAAYEDARGLYLETGDIVDTAHGSDVAKLLRGGIIRKLSIGFRVVREQRIASMEALQDFWKSNQYTPSDEDVSRATRAIKVGGLEMDEDGDVRTVKGVRMLRRIKLFEISPVTVPANMLADVTAVKSREVSAPPVSGTAFTDSARSVVTALGSFVRRAESRAEARFKVGRELSTANITSLESVADSLESGCRTLRALVERTKPAPAPKSDDATAAVKAEAQPEPAEVLAAGAATPAVTVDEPAPTPDQPSAPSAPDTSAAVLAELARYHAAVAASLGVPVGS